MSPGLAARAAGGGVLMGLANLVPGISGGTMLVATGIYGRFIDAVSDVTRLKFRAPSLLLLAIVIGSAGVAIGGLAWLISMALEGFRWGMYSLFIGLTLGGVPIMLAMLRPMDRRVWAGMVGGLVVMLAVVIAQMSRPEGIAGSSNPVMLGLAGVAGASAMILPGVSGAYLLLLLGQYERIIGAIKDFVHAGSGGDFASAAGTLWILVPVGVGVVVGVAAIGNLLRFLLHRYEKATLGFLLGLLIAAPAGLYPFKAGRPPEVGSVYRGEVVTREMIEAMKPKDWPEVVFTPGAGHLFGSLALIAAGFGGTLGVSRLGGGRG